MTYDNSNRQWFDRIVTPLNACSLETLSPVGSELHLTQNGDSDLVPLIIGCYQLNEPSASVGVELLDTDIAEENVVNDCGQKSTRSGELRLYMIRDDETLHFGEAHSVVPMESGVLDGKWRRRFHISAVNESNDCSFGKNSAVQCNSLAPKQMMSTPLFASACASGRIHLHALEKASSSNSWSLLPLSASEIPSTYDGNCLCLSLAWTDNSPNVVSEQLVSSYSNGTVALHEVSFNESDVSLKENDIRTTSSTATDVVSIHEKLRWNAHSMYGHPSEVWTCSFIRGDRHIVMSGADDCSLKIWDIRDTERPLHTIADEEFKAGVTAIASHPFMDEIFAAGSYDEYVRVYDRRKLNRPLWKVNVGGGVWRIKWHPMSCSSIDGIENRDCQKILVAAMHGGCCVVECPELNNYFDVNTLRARNGSDDLKVLSKFTAHQSMAYGADWIYFSSSRSREVVGSCSFYDRNGFLWGPNEL